MSRNRMKNSQSLHWMGVVKWVLILGLMSVLGLSYMFCKNQNLRLAAQTRRLRLNLEAIEQRNTTLSLALDGMKSPAPLQRRLVEMGSRLIFLYDPRMSSHVVTMDDQNTRMTLARMNTVPHVDINPTPVGTIMTSPDPQR